MKKSPIKIRFWLQFTAVVIVSLFLLGWGATGHRIINKSGARDFPNLSIVSPSIIQRLADSASVPDTRSGNLSEPKHFMDMEDIVGFSTHSITHNRDSLFLIYGETYIRNTAGFLPWVIDSVMSVLTDQMRSGDWNKAWSSAGDLGHYIGDAHQPLHATTNYNGYTTKYGSGSYGVHSRYETTMINSYQSSILIDSSAVHLIPNPLDTAFAIMYQSNSYVDSIYIADQYARTVVGSTVPQAYTDSIWAKTKNFTVLQFHRAAVEYGSFLYTAWVNAGKPSTFVEQWANQVREFHLEQNYPNPFNPSTVINYQVAVSSTVYMSVFDLLGRQVAILVNEKKPAGSYQVQWNASRVPSGVYFYQLSAAPSARQDLVSTERRNGQAGSISQTKKMLLLK